ncbi:MAG: hypothetical protein ABI870_06425 [Rhodanobacter sp.]
MKKQLTWPASAPAARRRPLRAQRPWDYLLVAITTGVVASILAHH